MSKKILIIDDEPAIITYLSTLFQDHGYEVVTSTSADDALEKARTEGPDLITLDLLMPDKTGIRLYRDLRKDQRLKEIPVIMVTGFTSAQHPLIDFRKFIYERSIPAPEGFIEKPVDPETLLAAVSAALAGRAVSST